MKLIRCLIPFVLPAALAAQSFSLVAASPQGTSGSLCDPWSCTPATVDANAGTTLQLTTVGAAVAPTFLLLSLPPAQCASIPGLGNALIVQPATGFAQLLNLGWGHFYVYGPGVTLCASWVGFEYLPLPAALPSGAQFLMQLLAPSPAGTPIGAWTFSNAVEVTVL